MGRIYFDDIEVGAVRQAGAHQVTRQDIVAFAERYDPQPFHLDEAAGRASLFGGLVASGIHTIAIWNHIRVTELDQFVMLAGLGLDGVRYGRPVRPGDVLAVRSECVEKTPSASKPDRGVVRFRHQVINQDGDEVMVAELLLMIARRQGGVGDGGR